MVGKQDYSFNPNHESLRYGANIYDPSTDTYYKKSGNAVWKWINWWLYLPCALVEFDGDKPFFLTGKQVIK